MEFPIFRTKTEGVDKKFDLTDVSQRREYFQLKAGEEIRKIKNYLKKNSFIAYLLGKKNSGKGTYSKMFGEIVGFDKTVHISVGDVVRRVHKEILESEERKENLIKWLEENYRGYISVEETIQALLNRSTENLLPTEFILSLIEREISKIPKISLFIDGFPRDLDQVSYSLFFRKLIDYRQDPDIFVLIDVPEAVINERIKWRRICPLCHTSRNLKLLPTSKVRYDRENKDFYLVCDNPECRGEKMIQKEGDEVGIKLIRERLNKDQELINKAFSLHGVPKILLRNSVPVDKAEELIDDYEVTPEYSYELDGEKVKIIKKPWRFYDDHGNLSYSLMPPPVVVSMIKQMVEILNL